MNISIGSDHAGFHLKSEILDFLAESGYTYSDKGCFSTDRFDCVYLARLVCQDIVDGKAQRGIMVCGSGAGAAIACNKIPGIRASVCHDIYTAHQCVEHDHVNVICLGAQIIGLKIAQEMLTSFLHAVPSTDEFFVQRIRDMDALERGYAPIKDN